VGALPVPDLRISEQNDDVTKRASALDREFDALLARMQTPKARRGMKRAFAASSEMLGQAAARAAKASRACGDGGADLKVRPPDRKP
jgi:hypothetical protein